MDDDLLHKLNKCTMQTEPLFCLSFILLVSGLNIYCIITETNLTIRLTCALGMLAIFFSHVVISIEKQEQVDALIENRN